MRSDRPCRRHGRPRHNAAHDATHILYNTLTQKLLQTERPDQVTLYVCGSTVYNFAHIGYARPAVVFDVLARLLRHDYARLIYARNFSDVDDRINAAAAVGMPIRAITTRYIDAYMATCRRWVCYRANWNRASPAIFRTSSRWSKRSSNAGMLMRHRSTSCSTSRPSYGEPMDNCPAVVPWTC